MSPLSRDCRAIGVPSPRFLCAPAIQAREVGVHRLMRRNRFKIMMKNYLLVHLAQSSSQFSGVRGSVGFNHDFYLRQETRCEET